jgi:hypothetical protein
MVLALIRGFPAPAGEVSSVKQATPGRSPFRADVVNVSGGAITTGVTARAQQHSAAEGEAAVNRKGYRL